MNISPEQISQYHEKGWTVVEEVFTRDEAEAIALEALKLSEAELKETSEDYKVDHSEDGKVAPRKIDRPFEKDPIFRNFVLDTRLREAITTFFGKEPLLVVDQIFMKPPQFGSAKPYHQDNAYFCCKPIDDVITAWIALDDVDEENGCLRYIDGSHKEGLVAHKPIPGEEHNMAPGDEDIDLSREAMGRVKKGGVCIHHGYALHTSHRNESDRWRRGFATHWVSKDVTCDIQTLDRAYYKRDDYPLS
jgi:phytanoyl-CoA hydroxylase